MAPEANEFLTRREVPDLHDIFAFTPRSQALAVGAERHTPDSGMAFEGDQLLACRFFPHLHGLVSAPGSQALAVGAECHAQHLCGMALEGEPLEAGRNGPDLHRVVKAPRSQAPAVRAERHALHLAG